MSLKTWQQVLPDYLEIKYTPECIMDRVGALGDEIGVWADGILEKHGVPLLAVCVVRGAVFFYADLLRAIPRSVETAFCRTWSYSSSENAQLDEIHGKGIRVDVDAIEAAGRGILIVDDICDTGATLEKLKNVFLELGAVEVKTAVLIHRLIDMPKHSPDWSAFQYSGDEWFVGYGMEDKNRLQNVPGVYIINK